MSIYTIDELCEWYKSLLCNKLVNPRTKRKIKKDKYTYNILMKQYIKNKHQIDSILNNVILQKQYNLLDSVDDRDPISLNIFWEEITVNQQNMKIIVYPEDKMNELIMYYDSNKLLRCFEIESLQHLKKYNITKHPLTQENIPDYILQQSSTILNSTKNNITNISDYALKVFQLFTNTSIINQLIDYNYFMNVNKYNLLRINYELNRLWNNVFTELQRNEITRDYIMVVSHELNSNNIDKIRLHILNNIKLLLQYNENKYKYIVHTMVLYCLAIVIPCIRTLYPDIIYQFN